MQEILVAVDGSEYSPKIVEYACTLAKKLSARMALIYVSKFPDLVEEYIGIGGKAPSAKGEQYVRIAEGITSKLAEIIRREGIPCEVILESGNPADKIVTTASIRKSAMIVVGLRGLHGLDKIRSLGSVSRRVLKGASCPVVVITGAYIWEK